MKIVVKLSMVALALLAAARPAWAAKSASCGTDVGLAVTIDGTQAATSADPALFPAGTNYSMVSDGGGTYVDGTKMKGGTLSAYLQVNNCTYDFTMNLGSLSRKAYIRDPSGAWVQMTFFNFDRIGSVPVLGAALSPNAQAFCNGIIVDPSNPNLPYKDPSTGIVYDDYAGCVFDSAVGQYYVRRAANISLASSGSTSSRYVLNPPYFSTNGVASPTVCSGADSRCTTSYLRVYHPTATTWTIVPEDVPAIQPATPPIPDDWVAGHQNCGNACTVDGFVSMPFKITMTAK